VSPIRQKLNSIILPVVDFEGTTLQEAVDFLRSRSRELDATELDPELKGLNFVIHNRTSRRWPAEDSLNLRAQNISIMQTLREISRQNGMRFRIDEYCITMLAPSSE
jgi:bla regulator protein blaR1